MFFRITTVRIDPSTGSGRTERELSAAFTAAVPYEALPVLRIFNEVGAKKVIC